MVSSVDIRKFKEGDENGIVSLLNTVYSSWPRFDIECKPIDHWSWKYNREKKIIVVAEDDDNIVGTMATLPLLFNLFGEEVKAGIGCDVAVHPDYRRQGIRNRMLELAPTQRNAAGLDFIYNITRNPISKKFRERMINSEPSR